MTVKFKKILVACHDAGGAEVVSAYVKSKTDARRYFCLISGPAKKIFLRKKLENVIDAGTIKNLENFFEKIGPVEMVLTGTSWGSTWELEMIQEAKKRGIKSVAYLDHWVNYRERFGYPRENWKNNLPDEIWIGDVYAQTIARKQFGKFPLKLVNNRYFEEVKNEYALAEQQWRGDRGGVLFVGEPLSSAINSFGDTVYNQNSEKQILTDILAWLVKIDFMGKVIVRCHPAEQANKYDDVIKKFQSVLNIKKSNRKNIFADLVATRYVIGMSSMFLVVARLCGKKVVSFLPWGDCPLPNHGIFKIKKREELAGVLKLSLK